MATSIDKIGMASGLNDRERDACLHRLGEHYAAGRLSADELDRRIQAALAAETHADLDAVMAEVRLDEEVDAGAAPGTGTDGTLGASSSRGMPRRAAALAALPMGGALLAVAGSGSDVAEFSAGLAVGLLGFATHWWMRRAPDVGGSEVGASAAAQEASEPTPARVTDPMIDPVTDPMIDPVTDTVIDQGTGPVTGRPVVAPPPALPRRPLGRGDGTIPGQRTGD